MRPIRFLSIATVAIGPAVLLASAASAQTAPARAVSYVNPDSGADTENSDVEPGSSCVTPDRSDTQPVGDPATGTDNVHNDACLLDAAGAPVDTQAAFELTGPAEFSACPDPDDGGPKTATLSGTTCILSGYEADNQEYHARIVGTGTGTAQITFCADPEGNGCADAAVADDITVTFQAASGAVGTSGPSGASGVDVALGRAGATPPAEASGVDVALGRTGAMPVGPVAAGEAPGSVPVPWSPVAAAGLVALAGSLLWSRRAA